MIKACISFDCGFVATAASKLLVLLLAPCDGTLERKCLEDVAEVKQNTDVFSDFCQLSDEDCANVIGILLGHMGHVTEGLIIKCPKLRVVARHGTGVDNVDIDAASKHGVMVCNVPDYGIEEVADTAFSHILSLYRQTTFLYEGLRKGVDLGSYDALISAAGASHRIRGSTLGLIGLGNIGMAVAQRAKAFGFNVRFYDPYLHTGMEKGLGGVLRVHTVEEVITASDCVSIHCPLTPENKHIINEESLKLFKKEAFLVNVSRGGLVDEAALTKALKEGRIAGAALDVQEKEPFTFADSILGEAPNLICTPHAAWYSAESMKEAREGACKPVRHAVTSSDHLGIINCINKRQLNMDACQARWK